jgi:NitT/TauT family transport system substrate-binding protein
MRRSDFAKMAALGLVAAAAAPRPARGQNLETLKLIAIPSDALTPLYYGIKTGQFQRAGIDLQIFPSMSGTAATQAVIAGAYDIGNTSILPVMNAHLRNVPIAIVAPQAVYTADNPFALLQQAADTNYKTGADLNGKTVAVSALNDISQLTISSWVDKHGGDASTLKFVEIPAVATDEALVQHRVAAGMLLEPVLDGSIVAGRTKTLGDAYGAIGRRLMFAAYVSRPDWAKKNADLLRRFQLVAGAAAVYTNQHPSETAEMMSEITKVPLAVMQHMRRVACATALDPQLIQPLIDRAAHYKLIPNGFKAEELFFNNGAA